MAAALSTNSLDVPMMLAMRRTRPPATVTLTRRQQLSSRPVRIVAGEMSAIDGGGGRLVVKLAASRRRFGSFLRPPANATRRFEFDVMGKFVWDHCDGTRTVQQIARTLAKQYAVSEREAQVATETFLTTLAKKGLIAAAVQRSGTEPA